MEQSAFVLVLPSRPIPSTRPLQHQPSSFKTVRIFSPTSFSFLSPFPCSRVSNSNGCPTSLPQQLSLRLSMKATSSTQQLEPPTQQKQQQQQEQQQRTTSQTKSTKQPPLDRVVCKFGGSSLADATRLKEVTKLVQLQVSQSVKPPIIVLSAMGPTTNELLSAGRKALTDGIVDMSSIQSRAYNTCQELGISPETIVDPLLINLDQLLLGVKFIKELSPRTLDYLVSFGERLSVRIFAEHLNRNTDIRARYLDAFDIGFRTNDQFTKAELLESSFGGIRKFFKEKFEEGVVGVVTGFIAKDEMGNMTTLGRGGSDLTASAIGAAVGVTEVQVWKDVDGILTTDPRIVEGARPVPKVLFEEAAEMAYFGAKVLHPIAMQPAMKWNIPVRVKNSYNPNHPGTVIVRKKDEVVEGEEKLVTAISLKQNVHVIDIVSTRMLGAYGFLAEVFKIFANHCISIDVIATSEVSVSITLDRTNFGGESGKENESKREVELKRDLEQISKVRFESGKAIVSIVCDWKKSNSVLARAMQVLERNDIGVHMISQGASKFNVSLVLDEKDAKNTVSLLHEEFFER